MHRDPHLRRLSSDHHHALVLARVARRGEPPVVTQNLLRLAKKSGSTDDASVVAIDGLVQLAPACAWSNSRAPSASRAICGVSARSLHGSTWSRRVVSMVT